MGFMISNKVFQQHFSTVNISWTKNFFEKSADLGMKKRVLYVGTKFKEYNLHNKSHVLKKKFRIYPDL